MSKIGREWSKTGDMIIPVLAAVTTDKNQTKDYPSEPSERQSIRTITVVIAHKHKQLLPRRPETNTNAVAGYSKHYNNGLRIVK